MTFREFLHMSEGMFYSKGVNGTRLTHDKSPGRLAQNDMNNHAFGRKGGAAAAPAAPAPGAKKMRKMKREHSTFGQGGIEFGQGPGSPMGITGKFYANGNKKVPKADKIFGPLGIEPPRLRGTKEGRPGV
jgi:hypothetical protein